MGVNTEWEGRNQVLYPFLKTSFHSYLYMEQVIELGNMPALKIHVQVVKKVDSVFKVGLPLAK